MRKFKITYNQFTDVGFTKHLTISALDENHAYFILFDVLSNHVKYSSKYHMSFVHVSDSDPQVMIIPHMINADHIDKFTIHEMGVA